MNAGETIGLERGRYVLRKQVAHSSYGVVWDAEGPGQRAVLKLVNRHQMERAHPDQRRHWIGSAATEIAFLRSLSPWDGRHIVRLLDSGEHDGLPVLALERLDCDLASHMEELRRSGKATGFLQSLDWLAQVNQALAKVHQYGWRHLDLKPGNLLLDPTRSSIRLADFGTNLPLAQRNPHPYTGTASWQAPEQFFPGDGGAFSTSQRTDYFALGALFYYLVTGGTTLQFCKDCGEAYRHNPAASARERKDTATLRDDEAARFLEAAGTTSGPLALALLRGLTDPSPSKRPRNALEISRQIAAIKTAATRRSGWRM